MEKHQILREEFIKALNNRITETNSHAEFLKNDDSNDEAMLEKIKTNVMDIFHKMFNASYNKVYGKPNSKIENSEDENYKNLYLAYMSFFDKIPSQWIANHAKAKEHNMYKEQLIEEIKINTANEIKDMFILFYKKY
ncbi:hypothetical protein Q428_14545 [Fervidicella metallireducens AeB]|uniref:Uncharacterized protein n=1 Tax=Fervidicella metallireducens AeB TaxID=1403537 RepID=A0A017RRX8_9CLOT|nr:hypothetical protein [Fervidicella metallireducens]EYE87214.1 hypothetical protein Q428_14545 [Fervidicella metallireducens AeB]